MEIVNIVHKLFNANGAIEDAIIDYFLLNKMSNNLYQITSAQNNWMTSDTSFMEINFTVRVPTKEGISIWKRMKNERS